MAFQTKDFVTILLGMINRAKSTQETLTDFRVGSVARTMLESPAAELDELYQQMFIGLKEAIPTAIYRSFDFQSLPARPASGLVTVEFSPSDADVVIAAGTVFSAPGVATKFASLRDVTVPAGQTSVAVFVSAQTAGASTNIPPGEFFTLAPEPAGFLSATNVGSFANGDDEESEERKKIRFREYIGSLNRGTLRAIKYGLSLASVTDANGLVVENVRHSVVLEPGYVQCHIHNGIDGASAALLESAERNVFGYYDAAGTPVPGWGGGGIKILIFAAGNLAVDVVGEVAIDGWHAATRADVVVQVQGAIADYLSGLGIGERAVKAELVAAAMAVDGVTNVHLPDIPGDVVAGASQKIVPGRISLLPTSL